VHCLEKTITQSQNNSGSTLKNPPPGERVAKPVPVRCHGNTKRVKKNRTTERDCFGERPVTSDTEDTVHRHAPHPRIRPVQVQTTGSTVMNCVRQHQQQQQQQ